MKLVQVDTRRFSKTALGKLTENQQKALKHIQYIYLKAFQRGARNGQDILGLPNDFDAKMVESQSKQLLAIFNDCRGKWSIKVYGHAIEVCKALVLKSKRELLD